MSTSSGLLESAIDKFAREGGFDDSPLKGKPIKIEDGDVLTGIMKNANYQPAWVELRKKSLPTSSGFWSVRSRLRFQRQSLRPLIKRL